MCSWPKGGQNPNFIGHWQYMYFNECMSGFEYQVAGHMIWEGMQKEGLAVARAPLLARMDADDVAFLVLGDVFAHARDPADDLAPFDGQTCGDRISQPGLAVYLVAQPLQQP